MTGLILDEQDCTRLGGKQADWLLDKHYRSVRDSDGHAQELDPTAPVVLNPNEDSRAVAAAAGFQVTEEKRDKQKVW